MPLAQKLNLGTKSQKDAFPELRRVSMPKSADFKPGELLLFGSVAQSGERLRKWELATASLVLFGMFFDRSENCDQFAGNRSFFPTSLIPHEFRLFSPS